ncbi:RNA-dependent RNA polymerase [Ilyonectria pseudodestructans chrysovirus 1]|nr:RNA-dependent RNA polymerase [Ilyonectria pseudodestructans chrysovirus 1]
MAGRMTRMPQSMRKKMIGLETRIDERVRYMGTDKYRDDFTLEVLSSIERFEARRRKNFYAIVMPSGSGKTQLADRYGFLDIDRIVTKGEHEVLNDMRIDILANRKDWKEHNEMWVGLVNQTLDLYSYNHPVVILVHSEILALQVGALPLGGYAPTDDLYRRTMQVKTDSGNLAGARLMSLNREEFLQSSCIVMKNKRLFSDYRIGEKLVIHTLNLNYIPTACPNKFSMNVEPIGYSEECPEWVLTGDKSKLDVPMLLAMFEAKQVPKACLDFFFRHTDSPSSFGFGLRDNEWVQVLAQIRSAITDQRNFDVGADMGEVFPYKYMKNKTRANITVSRLVKGMEVFRDDDCYYIASHHVGKPNNFVTAVLCYWIGVGSSSKYAAFIRELLCVSFFRWGSVMKEFHNFVRQSDYLFGEKMGELEDGSIDETERHKLMYLESLLGKEQEETDWMQEIEDRTWDYDMPDHRAYDPDLQMWTHAQYLKDFDAVLAATYSRLGKTSDPAIPNFEAFFKRRGAWLTKGSTVFNNLHPDMKKYTVDLINEVGEVVERVSGRHNKKSLFEVMNAIPELGGDFELFNATKIVTKLDENGHKRRALLPGSMLHYFVFCYVLHFVERDEQIGNVRLNAPADDNIEYFEMKMAAIPRLLFDWTNFNLYHSSWEMSKVIERLGAVIQGPVDYLPFVKAISESMYNMVIVDPEGKKHKAGRGLYSGWRGTSYINAVLNNCYTGAAVVSFKRMYHRDPYRYIDGGGDDHDGGLNNAEDGYLMLAIMRKMKFKATAIKQMVHMKSEFFRNTVTVQGAYASPVRALATFVNGKWEGSGNIPIKERVSGILDQVAKLRRRGVDVQFCSTLSVLCLSHWCKVNEDGEWLDLPGYVIHGSSKDGGFGVPDDRGEVWRLQDRVPEPRVIGEAAHPPGTLATRDWLNVLCREVQEMNIEVEVSRQKVEEMALASFDVYGKYDYTNVINFKTTVLSKEKAVEPRSNPAAWEILMEFIATENKKTQIGRVMRYQEILPYMSVGGKPISQAHLCEILGVNVNEEVFDFQGDIYYRRLIAEPLATLVTEFCMEGIARGSMSRRKGEELFKDLCYMMYMNTEFKI